MWGQAICVVVQIWKQAERLHLEQQFSHIQAVCLHRNVTVVSQEKNQALDRVGSSQSRQRARTASKHPQYLKADQSMRAHCRGVETLGKCLILEIETRCVLLTNHASSRK